MSSPGFLPFWLRSCWLRALVMSKCVRDVLHNCQMHECGAKNNPNSACKS